MRSLEWMWRLCGTAVSFSLFGIGGLALTLFVFPVINVVYRDRDRRAEVAQHVVHFTWRIFVRTVVGLRVIAFEAEGASVLRGESGALIIANHPSLIDVVLIMSLMDRTQCVVKPGVWKNPFMRGVVTATNYIPNLGDPEQMVEDCVAALRAGHNLVIFPEGSRTVPGKKVRLQRGFANIALRAQAPVRLVTVTCEPPTLRKGEKWYQIPPRRPLFRVRVGDRLDIEAYARSEIPSRAARTLTADVARRFEELAEHGAA
jgi:1-acyl-sn-glycerol-3-phosphate acyltransferase